MDLSSGGGGASRGGSRELGTIYLIAGIGTLNMTGDFPIVIGVGPSRLKRMSCQRLLFI